MQGENVIAARHIKHFKYLFSPLKIFRCPVNLGCAVPIDPNSLPNDPNALQKIVPNLAGPLDRAFAEQEKYRSLLRELLEAQRERKSEQLSKERLALLKRPGSAEPGRRNRGGRRPLGRQLLRERDRPRSGRVGKAEVMFISTLTSYILAERFKSVRNIFERRVAACPTFLEGVTCV
jgi:hypothetical protein